MKFEDIKKLIDKMDKTVRYRSAMYKRYTTEAIPIETELNPAYIENEVKEKSKPDRRLYNHFEKEIVDSKVTYFVGHPVMVSSYNGDEGLNKFIDDFNISVNYEDLFAEIVKDSASAGVGGVLLYKNKDAEPRAIVLNPAEFMVWYYLQDPIYAIRKYIDDDDIETVEYFDENYIYSYKKMDGEWVNQGEVLHGFSRVPIIEVVNNKECQSDYHSVVKLIDAYNRLISDLSNEIESFRLAYMVLENYRASEEDLQKIRMTGAIQVDKDGKVYFLTKNIDTKAVETMREILERNICRFSGHVDTSTEPFVGNLTRIAVAFKLKPLEQKTLGYERKFKSFLRELYNTLFTFKAYNVNFDYKNLVFNFTRNVPVNTLEEVDMLVKLDGQVSDETRLGMMSFIDNPQDELAKMEEEKNKASVEEEPVEEEPINNQFIGG